MLDWYALNSKPHSEKTVYDALAARGIEAYLPVWQSQRRRAPRARPFFPCYLFVHADLEVIGLSALQYLPGVRRVVFCGDQPARVSQQVIDRIRVRLTEMDNSITDMIGEPLSPGDHVVITEGPLAGLEAVFDRRLSSDARVQLLINFLQRGTRLDIEPEFVRKVNPQHRSAAPRGTRGK